MIPFPPIFIAYSVAAVVVLASLWGVHRHVEGKGYERGKAECIAAAAEQREKELKAGNEASTALERSNEKARVVYRTITKNVDRIVQRDVYRNTCLDSDGLLAANAALRGPSADPAEPDKPVPGSRPDGGRHSGLRVAQDCRGC